MRIVFLYPAWTGEYGLFGHFAKRNSTWPPLSLALLGAVCEQAGHEAVILDGEAMHLSGEQLAARAVALKPDIVGLTAYSPFFHLSAETAQSVKKINPDIPIIVGGPHITIMKEKAFLPQFDYLFMGEAERSLPEFLSYRKGLDYTLSPTHIRGMLWKDMLGTIHNNGGAAWLTEISTKGRDLGQFYPLDGLPFPARHLLPMGKYRLGTLRGRLHFTSIQSFRGCPWTCQFCCSEKLNTTRVIMKSPKTVVAEMVKTVTDFPFITHFYIVDDVLTLWPKHIMEICHRINAEPTLKGKITFEGSTRANLVTDELIKYMSKTGLIRLSFGLETTDPKMRVTMQKKVPMDAYPEANRICAKYGVEALNSLMIGLPGETRETIKTTIEWVRSQRDISQANVAIAVPYPGTEFGDMALEGTHGVELLDTDFSKYLRYGNAVTKVGDIGPQELVDWQNWAFVRIYSAPWRWGPTYAKHGVIGLLLQLYRVFKLWIWLIRKKAKPFRLHPGYP